MICPSHFVASRGNSCLVRRDEASPGSDARSPFWCCERSLHPAAGGVGFALPFPGARLLRLLRFGGGREHFAKLLKNLQTHILC